MSLLSGVNNGMSFGLLTQAKQSAETTGSLAAKKTETTGQLAKVSEPLFNFGASTETTGSVASSNSDCTFAAVA